MLSEYTGKINAPILSNPPLAKNHVNFLAIKKDGDTEITMQTCKETFVTHIHNIFLNKKKYVQLTIGINIRTEDFDKLEWLIHNYETQVLKLKNNSKMFKISKINNLVIIVPSRRWFRNPSVTHILLTLCRMASSVDLTKDLLENLKLFKKINIGGGHDHYNKAVEIFDGILTDGFNTVFNSSKSFEKAWYIANDDYSWPGGAYCALAYFKDMLVQFGDFKKKKDLPNLEKTNKDIRNKFFIGFSSSFLNKFLPEIGKETIEASSDAV